MGKRGGSSDKGISCMKARKEGALAHERGALAKGECKCKCKCIFNWASQTLLAGILSHMGHAYATRCVYKYRVQLIAPTASGNVERGGGGNNTRGRAEQH